MKNFILAFVHFDAIFNFLNRIKELLTLSVK